MAIRAGYVAVMAIGFLNGCCLQVLDEYRTRDPVFGDTAGALLMPSWREYGIPVLFYVQTEGSPYDVSFWLPKFDRLGREFERLRLDAISFYAPRCGWSEELCRESDPTSPTATAGFWTWEYYDIEKGRPDSVIRYDVPYRSMLVGCGARAEKLRSEMRSSSLASDLWVESGLTLSFLSVRYTVASIGAGGKLEFEHRREIIPLARKRSIYPLPGVPYWRHGP